MILCIQLNFIFSFDFFNMLIIIINIYLKLIILTKIRLFLFYIANIYKSLSNPVYEIFMKHIYICIIVLFIST